MRRFVSVLGLLFALVLTTSACGGGNGESASSPEPESSKSETANSVRKLPEGGALSAGKYRTEKFTPAFSFEVGKGWSTGGPEFEDVVFLTWGEDYSLGFANPQKVFDPEKPLEQKEMPAPDTVDGWVAWHKESPHLKVTDVEPASVGGATGKRFDLAVASAPRKSTELCGDPCVPGFPVGPIAVDFFLGYEEQDLVLKVGDEIVLISAAAPEGDLEEFLPKAQKVLDSVEWENVS
jgi:hypothetical protein